jgi:serine/threonine protein kinase
LAVALVEAARRALPGEPALALRLAELLAAQREWVRLYPLLEQSRRQELGPEQREQVARLYRQELAVLRRELPESIREGEWAPIRAAVKRLEHRFRGDTEFLVLQCLAITALARPILVAGGPLPARFRRLAREYHEARKAFYALPVGAQPIELVQALQASEAFLGGHDAELFGLPRAAPAGPAPAISAGPVYGESGGEELSLGGVLRRVRGLERVEQLRAIRDDQRARWRRGERVAAEDYLQRQSDLGESLVRELVVGEVALRQEAGEAIPSQEFPQRFPQLIEPSQPEAGRSVNVTIAPAPAVRIAPPSGLLAVPGYEIREQIGRGGMGVVYKAWDTGLQRPVAVKMLVYGGCAGPEQVARFEREAAVLGRVQHPNVVRVYGYGVTDGQPFLAMELLEGNSLANKLAGAPLPPHEAVSLAESLASALHVVHEQGIVHRDVKPSNVLFSQDGIPKIVDFGLAKLLDQASPGQTQTGAVVGTPSYMAPEQAQGRVEQIGPRTDVYSLGATLYELLTGRPPFKAATPLDTILQVMHDEPVPPRQLNTKVPRDLETICLKCLHKEPQRRYASAQALADDLRLFLEGRPISARPVSQVERLRRWCKRNPAMASLLLLTFFLLITGALISNVLALQLRKRAEAEARLRGDYDQVTADRDRLAEEARQLREELKRARQGRSATRKAALEGRPDAMYRLGRMYELGQDGEKDEEKAVRWYRKAAQQGHAAAQYNLGALYEKGRGVPRDEEQAVRWYRKAAAAGNKEAQAALQRLHQ